MHEKDFQKILQELLPQNTATLVVAVSGGADSLALCLLAKNYSIQNNIVLHTVTIDHNLRSESADEAVYVNTLLSKLKISHTTLVWQHKGNIKRLHENARQARYQLLTDYAKQFKNSVLLTAHHAHDQAETVMMRLLKGSALKGLTGIAPLSVMNDTFIIRPLLHANPDKLKTYLKEKNIKWLEDPSNHNTNFERTRIRNLLAHMQKEGFTVDGINKSANSLKTSSNAVEKLIKQHEQNFLLTIDPLTIDQKKFFSTTEFVQTEWLRNTLFELGNANYRKPFATIKAVLEILKAPKVNGYKICGCNIEVAKKIITIIPPQQN